MKLTDQQKPLIATIIAKYSFDNYDVVGLMIELYSLGLEPDHHNWQVIMEIKEHLDKRVLRQNYNDGHIRFRFGNTISDLIKEFFNTEIDPWIRATYPKVWFFMKQQNNDYSLEHMCDYEEWVGASAELFMESHEDMSEMMNWGWDIVGPSLTE